MNHQRDMEEKDKKIAALEKQIKDKDQKHSEELHQLQTSMDTKLNEIREEMNVNQQLLEAQKTVMKIHDVVRHNLSIDFAIKKYYKKTHNLSIAPSTDFNDLKEYLAMCKLAYDEAMKDEDNFKNTDKHISTLFAIVEMCCKRDPNLLDNTIIKLKNKNKYDNLDEVINEIINLFINDSELLELTNCDIQTLRQIVQIYVFEHQELIEKVGELTKIEKDNIIDDILIECVKFNAQNN